MEKEEIIKKLEELGKKDHLGPIKSIKSNIESGDYKQAFSTLFYTAKGFDQYEAEAKELAKEIGELYVGLALKEIREKAATDRVSAKISLSDLENDMKQMGMEVPSKYDETRNFVYGLAPEQNESDEKLIEEFHQKNIQEHAMKTVVDAKRMVRGGLLLDYGSDTIDKDLQVAKLLSDKFGFQLPPEYPENGDWKNGWKKDALEYIDECIKIAQELSKTDHGKGTAKQSLGYAKNYASQLGIELPPEYGDLERLLGDVSREAAEWPNKYDMKDFEEKPDETAAETEIRRAKTEKVAWKVKVKFARELISDLRSSDKHSKEDVKSARTHLRNFEVTSEIYHRPLPPEYYVLKKLVNWKVPDGKEPPAERVPSEEEKNELEKLKEQKSGRFWKKREHAGAEKTKKNGRERMMTQDEVYGLRKELESSGHPKHMEALEELRNGHYGTAARLIDVAAESDGVQISEEALAPLYEEAIRDMLNGALAFESDPALLRGRLEDVKKYVSRVAGLPEDLSALYEFLCRKADGRA